MYLGSFDIKPVSSKVSSHTDSKDSTVTDTTLTATQSDDNKSDSGSSGNNNSGGESKKESSSKPWYKRLGDSVGGFFQWAKLNVTSVKKLKVEATAYSGDGITASGVKTKREPDGESTIAVDPSVIPLGSKVYVENYGYAIAADTGGAIKGNIIDLFMDSESECEEWGRRNVNIYIIEEPKK